MLFPRCSRSRGNLAASRSENWSRHVAKVEVSPAQRAVIEEWNAWAKKHPDRTRIAGGILFFNYLQKKRPDLLLDFRSSGDKWQTIHSWLLSERKVTR